MMMSPLTFKEIFAATIEVCTVLLADFCVFPGACFLYILTNSRSVESNILLASLKPGKLGGLWQQGHLGKIVAWDIGFSHSHLCGCCKPANSYAVRGERGRVPATI